MELFAKATFRFGAILQSLPTEREHRSFVVTIDGTPVAVPFVDDKTMEAIAQVEVSDGLYQNLKNDEPGFDSWEPALQEELKAFVRVPMRGFARVHETLTFVVRNYQMKEMVRPADQYWSENGTTWRNFVIHKFYVIGRAHAPSYFGAELHGRIQRFLDSDRSCSFRDAFRHLHRAENERHDPRHAWIDATIAAELAIKEFYILLKPELAPFVLEVPSPPLSKLYGPILESFTGQRSPVLNNLREGAEIRNRLLHRPNEKVEEDKFNTYFRHVDSAIFHLLSLLYPDDELVKEEFRLAQAPVTMVAFSGPAPTPPPPPATGS